MFKRHLKLAAFLSIAWVSAAASAGELTLFAGPGFQGRDLSVRSEIRDLTQFDFNDRTSSIVVRSGRWEACVDADFRNRCQIYEPGEYPDLERMGNAITSVREIEGGRGDERGDNRGDDRGERRGEHRGRGREGVELFALPDFGGARFAVRQDYRQMERHTFDDQAASLIVYSGQWEFCQHPDFNGQCLVFGPGEYRNLDRSLQYQITSVRQVGQERGRRDERRREGVELFSNEGFDGDRFQVREDYRQLDRNSFDDRAESLIVYSGRWQFCQHPDFGGKCMTYGPGRYDRLGSLHRQITSIRQVR
ncbi:MAG: beta/gamma crystallin-related protein [Pseudomonadota bacterium]